MTWEINSVPPFLSMSNPRILLDFDKSILKVFKVIVIQLMYFKAVKKFFEFPNLTLLSRIIIYSLDRPTVVV